ncbi:hypothetical protein [Bremerella cremea]|uniref:hypothetical protein n=1 Tax=Bremerella cremea TaxID=1031537 RepID=UPI0011C023C7|nr:hypothetical protein [Bremerella cremea]
MQIHSYSEAIEFHRTTGYPIFEDGVVMELLVMLPTLFLIYGSIGAVVAILSSLVGQHMREFVMNTVRY